MTVPLLRLLRVADVDPIGATHPQGVGVLPLVEHVHRRRARVQRASRLGASRGGHARVRRLRVAGRENAARHRDQVRHERDLERRAGEPAELLLDLGPMPMRAGLVGADAFGAFGK